MDWIYNGSEITSIEDFPEGVVGFIYLLVNKKGQKYVGKKSLLHTDTRKLSQKAAVELKIKGISTRKRRYKESD